jgi:voltage-gated potassium channel
MHLIEELVATKRESLFIELDPDVIKQVIRKYPMQKYIEGDATNDDTLVKAGVERAKGLFAATTDDNMNLVISLSAKRLNPSLKVVALCTIHNNQDKLKMAGADQIVSPNYIGGMRMASEMLRPTVTQLLDVMLRGREKNLRIEQIDMNEKNEGKKLGELKLGDLKDTLLIALKSNDELIFKPDDEYVIKNGDSLVVMTTPDERIKLENTKLNNKSYSSLFTESQELSVRIITPIKNRTATSLHRSAKPRTFDHNTSDYNNKIFQRDNVS